MQLIRPDIHIDFIGRSKIAFMISAIMILTSLGALAVKGLNFGIDFTGGTLVEVKFDQAPTIADVRDSISPKGYGNAVIQEFGAPNEVHPCAKQKY